MSSRIFTRNAFETGLDGGISDSETTITLDTTVGLSFPGILVFNDDDPVLREYVEYTGISTNDLTGCTRGGEGSAGGIAHAHSTGARVRSVYTHQIQDRIWDDIEDLETADTDHVAAGDPHTGYVLESAHDKALHDGLNIDADTLDSIDSTGFTLIAHDGAGGAAHADVIAAGADGFMTGADKTILDTLGKYNDWSPTYTNLTVGNGTVVSRFTELPGGLVIAHYELEFGSTTTIDGTGPTISTPVTAVSTYTVNHNWIGGAMLLDSGNSFFTGMVRFSTVDRFEILAQETILTFLRSQQLSSVLPMIWTTGDKLSFGAFFEAAP